MLEKDLTNRSELIEALNYLKAMEIAARDNYLKDIITFSNVEIEDTIREIKIDEDKHIALIEDLLEMLRKN